MFRKMFTGFLAVSLVAMLAGCGAKDTKLADIQKSGKLVLGTSADYPPYEFHKKVNGKDEIVGFDVEIAKAIAADLGVQLEIKDMSFDGLLAALTAGNVDIVLAGMTPDEKRKKSVDFSKIYYQAEQGVVVPAANKDKYKSMDDLKGLRIGVQTGSIQEEIAKTQIPNADIKGLQSVSDLMLQLKSNKVDALVVELPVATAYVDKNKELAVSGLKPKEAVGGSAVAIKKNNPSLVKEVDKTIDKLISGKKIDEFTKNASAQMAE
ncbi:ABC transporter substrate-binding protein [Paenibacillus aurantius]|uniref:ABC transporter substrate-binding protein n=1 Tax=Paenibacillus aurantius TaxID=2918900 RepID=A0AA96LHF3_9BACL|nr:ABC transporter substrate-binding protein [Paenibacillus aurantius]WNQ13038.1 ABC transporter substrate-binding protein [Paenibacillus aurantius]